MSKVRCPRWETCEAGGCPHYGEHDYIPECAEPCDFFDDEEDVLCEPVDEEAVDGALL